MLCSIGMFCRCGESTCGVRLSLGREDDRTLTGAERPAQTQSRHNLALWNEKPGGSHPLSGPGRTKRSFWVGSVVLVLAIAAIGVGTARQAAAQLEDPRKLLEL